MLLMGGQAGREPWRFPENASRLRTHIYHVTESKSFGALVLIVILLNTFVLLLQTDSDIRVQWGWWFSCLDFIFLAIYQLEFMMKFYALHCHYFASGANKLDFAIVIVTIADFLLPIIVQNSAVLQAASLLKLVKISRSIKAIRAIRVLRTIRFLKNLQVIFNTVMKSVKALGTIAFLISFCLVMFAVIGRGLFSELSPECFGNTGYAMVTLFQLMTLDDWFLVFQKTQKENMTTEEEGMHWFLFFYMVVFIFFQYFIFLNLLVAVIVDNFQRSLSASDTAGKNKTSNRRTAIFMTNKDDESVDDEDKISASPSSSEPSIVFNTIEDYYTETDIPDKRDRQLLHNFYKYLSMLEYNIHQNHVQQKLLDDLVDVTATISDVPEDLI